MTDQMRVSGGEHIMQANEKREEEFISWTQDNVGNIVMAVDAKQNLRFCEGALNSVIIRSNATGCYIDLLVLLSHAQKLVASIETGNKDWRPHYAAIRQTLEGTSHDTATEAGS